MLGDVQFLRGYSLLLPDPVVSDLNTLTGTQRDQFLQDMAMLGDVLLAVTGASRMNYEIWVIAKQLCTPMYFPDTRLSQKSSDGNPYGFMIGIMHQNSI